MSGILVLALEAVLLDNMINARSLAQIHTLHGNQRSKVGSARSAGINECRRAILALPSVGIFSKLIDYLSVFPNITNMSNPFR